MLTLHQFASAWICARVRNDRAASLVEYALLLALIAIVCVAAVATLGGKTKTRFSSLSTSF